GPRGEVGRTQDPRRSISPGEPGPVVPGVARCPHRLLHLWRPGPVHGAQDVACVVRHHGLDPAPVPHIPASDDERHLDLLSRHLGEAGLERVAVGAAWRVRADALVNGERGSERICCGHRFSVWHRIGRQVSASPQAAAAASTHTFVPQLSRASCTRTRTMPSRSSSGLSGTLPAGNAEPAAAAAGPNLPCDHSSTATWLVQTELYVSTSGTPDCGATMSYTSMKPPF